jgi:hypothetical protein
MSRKGIRHIFSRLLVLYAALYTIDISVDTDHLKSDCVKSVLETYDDIDSFSEYVIEYLADNDKLMLEGDHDDQDTQHEMKEFAREIKLMLAAHDYDISPVCLPVERKASLTKNTPFQYKDFTLLVAPPPKQA